MKLALCVCACVCACVCPYRLQLFNDLTNFYILVRRHNIQVKAEYPGHSIQFSLTGKKITFLDSVL